MSSAFAQHLEDFGKPDAIAQLPGIMTTPAETDFATSPDLIDIDQEKAMSYQEGYAAARAEMEAERQADLETLRKESREEMSRLEQEIGEKLAVQLGSDLTRQVGEFAQNMQLEVGQILRQLVDAEIVEKSLSELALVIESSFLKDPEVEVKIAGPENLLNKMKARLGEQFSSLNFVESSENELSIAFDQTLITTQLGHWRKNLELISHER